MVDGSSWKERMPRRTRSGTSAGASRSAYRLGAATPATTALRATTVSPSVVCTVRARPPEVPMRSTAAEQRISPPLLSSLPGQAPG